MNNYLKLTFYVYYLFFYFVQIRKRHGENMICATSYEPCVMSHGVQQLFEKRLNCVDIEVTPPSEILSNRAAYFRSFPVLDKNVLNQECASR